MADRTDYTASALSLAAYGTSPEVGSPEVGALIMAEAQVHATLALVEQQRIANLIAIHHDDFPPSLLDEAGWNSVRAQIREGLGL